MTSPRADNPGAVSTGLLPPHWRAPRQQTSEDNDYWPGNYNRNNWHPLPVPRPGARRGDPGAAGTRRPLAATATRFLPPHGLQPGAGTAAPPARAVKFPAKKILISVSPGSRGLGLRPPSGGSSVQNGIKIPPAADLLHPSPKKFGRRCWESWI